MSSRARSASAATASTDAPFTASTVAPSFTEPDGFTLPEPVARSTQSIVVSPVNATSGTSTVSVISTPRAFKALISDADDPMNAALSFSFVPYAT